MHGAIPPPSHTYSWHGTWLSTGATLPVTIMPHMTSGVLWKGTYYFFNKNVLKMGNESIHMWNMTGLESINMNFKISYSVCLNCFIF
jgi:hypothetical protein